MPIASDSTALPSRLSTSPMAVTTELRALAHAAMEYGAASKSPATLRAYESDLADFTKFAARHGYPALPAPGELVALYLADLANRDLKPATIQRRLSAIRSAHLEHDLPSPTNDSIVLRTMAGIRRTKGTRPAKKKALRLEDLQAMADAIDLDTTIGLRDHALLLVGFMGGFRRSELVALDVADLEWTHDGVVGTVRRSKTDQDGRGRQVAIPDTTRRRLSAPLAVRRWLDRAGITSGPVFRAVNRHGGPQGRLSDQSVALIVKARAEAVGLESDLLAGHSLRSGLATSAAAAGASAWSIQRTTGHASLEVLGGYIQAGRPFDDCAASILLGHAVPKSPNGSVAASNRLATEAEA